MKLPRITAERLREVLHYAPDTGIWTWLVWPSRGLKRQEAGSLSDNYVVIRVDGILYLAHRLAFLYMTGKWPTTTIDHKDRNPTNCRWLNLRPATRTQQNANSRARAGTSKYKGVGRRRDGWRAYICKDGVNRYLGDFQDEADAAIAYNFAAYETFGAFAQFNAVV